ncbi:MAG: formate dehydrogenase iron-sulfur subunit, partial [Halioglobus sp.]
MSPRVYVPSDSTARSLGADAIAESLKALPIEVEVIRNGSRGMFWLEPMIEIETRNGRVGFPNMDAESIPALFSDGVPSQSHPQCIGLVEHLDYLKNQHRLTSIRIGVVDPQS